MSLLCISFAKPASFSKSTQTKTYASFPMPSFPLTAADTSVYCSFTRYNLALWHAKAQTNCGCIPKKNTELSLFAHTGTQDMWAYVKKHTNTDTRGMHKTISMQHSGEALLEQQMEKKMNVSECTARLMPIAIPCCLFAPSEFVIYSSFGQTVQAYPACFLCPASRAHCCQLHLKIWQAKIQSRH